jgi:hypothetical protein
MMQLSTEGNVTHNVAIHSVSVTPMSLLSDLLKPDMMSFPINSVHNVAITKTAISQLSTNSGEPLFFVAAESSDDWVIDSKTRQGLPYSLQTGLVEAFSSNFGTFILATQWHPEANVDLDQHKFPKQKLPSQAIFRYMVQASTAYSYKHKMLAVFSQRFTPTWKNTQSHFCTQYKLNRGNFCCWLNKKKNSPASRSAILAWNKSSK